MTTNAGLTWKVDWFFGFIMSPGGQFVDLKGPSLTQQEKDILARTFNGASKATAHLTCGSNHGMSDQDYFNAVDIIQRLLYECLYSRVAGVTMP